jgi:hypothetical protein
LNMTYRYDNLREGIVGRNPATAERPNATTPYWRRRTALMKAEHGASST